MSALDIKRDAMAARLEASREARKLERKLATRGFEDVNKKRVRVYLSCLLMYVGRFWSLLYMKFSKDACFYFCLF